MKEQSNTREAYFHKAELAWAVLSLVWEGGKMHHVVWPDSEDKRILCGCYFLTNPVYVDRPLSMTWKKPSQTADLANTPKGRRNYVLPAEFIN